MKAARVLVVFCFAVLSFLVQADAATISTRVRLKESEFVSKVGETLVIEGSLRSNGEGLPSRYVYLEIGGQPSIRFRTQADGYFRYTVTPSAEGIRSGRVVFRGNEKYSPNSSNFRIVTTAEISVSIVFRRKEISLVGSQGVARIHWQVIRNDSGSFLKNAKLRQERYEPSVGDFRHFGGGNTDDNGIVVVSNFFPASDYGKTFTFRASMTNNIYRGSTTKEISFR